MNPEWILQLMTYAAPVLFASLGGLIGEKSGLVDISLEGKMLCGALAAAAIASATGNPIWGVVAAAVAGAALSIVTAAFAIAQRRDQVIVGTTVNFLALGLTGVLARSWTKANPDALTAESLPRWIGPVDPLTLLGFVLVPLLWWFLQRTSAGIVLRTAGERPAAAAAAGIRINRLRTGASLACGALCGLGGACISIGIANNFAEEMTAGRGFVALAVVVFGRWSPLGVLGASLVFAAADMLQTRLQAAGTLDIPYPVFLAVPYVLTLLALAARGSRAKPPAALGEPWSDH
jgi:ABC-type uncharacterized transport system permease subunit